jgi:hypothetical protein
VSECLGRQLESEYSCLSDQEYVILVEARHNDRMNRGELFHLLTCNLHRSDLCYRVEVLPVLEHTHLPCLPVEERDI